MVDPEKVLDGLEACADRTGALCKNCPYDFEKDSCISDMARDAFELLEHDEQTIASLQSTIDKLTKALAEQPEQKFFVDSDGKMTPLPVQKHGHWVLDPDGMDWNIPAWKCSECHCRNDNIPPNLERMNPLRWSGSKFCPNCGAKMDEKVMQDA